MLFLKSKNTNLQYFKIYYTDKIMKKLTLVLFLIGMFSVSAHAGTDNQNALSKKSSNGEVKDCFERVNRGIFAFNQSLDEAVFEPLARGYRKLPSPVKTGTSNFLSNISNLISIPNNILQGDLKNAGVNSGRLILNTTIGIYPSRLMSLFGIWTLIYVSFVLDVSGCVTKLEVIMFLRSWIGQVKA